MKLMLNDILNLSDKTIQNSKIELNMHAGRGGQPFLDRWLKYSDEEKSNGTCPNCSYWAWYTTKQRNFVPGQFVFSFARMYDDKWLLISAAQIIDVLKADWAVVEVLEKFRPLFGRLIINCKKGNTNSRYVFNMKKYIDVTTVEEILPCIYSGEKFNGYDNINLPFHRLADIFNGKILPTYYEALKKITGIYCLTDTNTGKLYIGSATGGEGVAQRWGNYLDSKHGGNKKLIELYNKEGSEYFEKHFTYTLIEYFGLSYDPIKIIEREQYWKKCFDTIKHGYNDN